MARKTKAKAKAKSKVSKSQPQAPFNRAYVVWLRLRLFAMAKQAKCFTWP